MPSSNACPQCGWFAPSWSEWPRWNPAARAAATEAMWAETHAWEGEEAAAERRARRVAEGEAQVARVREQRLRLFEERQARRLEREARHMLREEHGPRGARRMLQQRVMRILDTTMLHYDDDDVDGLGHGGGRMQLEMQLVSQLE